MTTNRLGLDSDVKSVPLDFNLHIIFIVKNSSLTCICSLISQMFINQPNEVPVENYTDFLGTNPVFEAKGRKQLLSCRYSNSL